MPPLPAASPVPDVLRLAAHPIRWRLLAELARSDRHVNELTRLVGEPQALVSYHLGLLRAGGLVTARRSTHDGRASYYALDLARAGADLAAAGTALHPGLAGRPAPRGSGRAAPPPSGRPGRRSPVSVLFACTGNGARSQIAEALLEQRAGDRVDVVSGGSHPKPVHPNAVRVLAERGIDIRDRRSKPLDLFTERHFDHVVTLCDKVREACPEFSTRARAIHWSIPDPGRVPGDDEATYPVFRALADELETRVGFLVALIDDHPAQETTDHVRP